jgi:biofilm PGA synthesis lipoprotein PgaB
MHRPYKNFLASTLATVVFVYCSAQAAPRPAPHLVVLQYHHVSSSTPASTSLTPERFEEHLQWLEDNAFTVVDLPTALATLRSGGTLPDKTAAITFDDGYYDVYAAAFPILRDRQLPFTIFINPEPHDAGRPGWASWDQLREMGKSGGVIANHTNTHLFMVRRMQDESKSAWLERLEQEITSTETRIKAETDQSHKMLAYPFGESNRDIRQLMENLGYTAFGQQSGSVYAGSNFTDLPRFPLSGVYSGMTGFSTKMLSLPMNVDSITPESRSQDNTLYYDEKTPALTLRLANKSQLILNCFASGQDAISVDYEGAGTYRVQANEPLSNGRSRYNCTHSSEWPGRYHWFSYAWVKRDQQEQWSHQ